MGEGEGCIMGKLILFPNPGTPLRVSNAYLRGPEGSRGITIRNHFGALFSRHFDYADPQLGLREGEGHAKWKASSSPILDFHLMHQMVMGLILVESFEIK